MEGGDSVGEEGSPITTATSYPSPLYYALLGVGLVAICLGHEALRVHIPSPRSRIFLGITWLHELAVLGVLGLIWHGLLHSMFRTWLRVMLWIFALLILLVGMLAISLPAMAKIVLEVGFNQLVLPLYIYLGLYRPIFAGLVLLMSVLLFCVHLFRHNWLNKGWVYQHTGAFIRRYLERYPDAQHYLALKEIQWEVFGQTIVDLQYENTLRQLTRNQQEALNRERLERCTTQFSVVQDNPKFPLAQGGHGGPYSHHHYKANLARYLTMPVADGQYQVSQLLEAAEVYYELQVVWMPENSGLLEDHDGYARSERNARALELELYEHLLGRTECRPNPQRASLGGGWDVYLTLYERGCRFWQALPAWARGFLCFDQPQGGTTRYDVLTQSQQQLVRFLAKPSEELDDLLRTLTDNDLYNAVTRRLFWMAIAKWIALVEAQGQLYYEVLIDGYTCLRRVGLPADFWGAAPPFEVGPDDHNWLQQLCSTKLGIAWLNYSQSLSSIRGSDGYRDFAYHQAVSNLTAGGADSLLVLMEQSSYEVH